MIRVDLDPKHLNLVYVYTTCYLFFDNQGAHQPTLIQFSSTILPLKLIGISIPRYPVFKEDPDRSTQLIPVPSVFGSSGIPVVNTKYSVVVKKMNTLR